MWFIGDFVALMYMVSRSLEKMMLIAVGLSAAVIVGVPILLYSINLLNNTTSLEIAENFADQLHSIVYNVDNGVENTTEYEVIVPQGVTVSASGHTLTVSFTAGEQAPVQQWSETYQHNIDLVPPAVTGSQLVTVELVEDVLQIRFIPHP